MIELTTLVIGAVLAVVFYFFLNRNSTYWKVRKVPYIPPLPVIGNLKSLLSFEKCVGEYVAELYNAKEAQEQPVVGIHLFNCRPALVIRDPEILKGVLTKDFEHFTDRSVSSDEKKDPIGYHNMFSVRGAEWKYVRTKLSPTFSTGKIKQMFLVVKELGENLVSFLDERVKGKDSVTLECKSLMMRFTIDVISSCAFGMNTNCLTNDESVFRSVADSIFRTSIKRAIDWRALFFAQEFAGVFNCFLFGKKASDFFGKVFNEALEEREKKQIFRNDFFDILMALRKEQQEKIKNQTAEKEDLIYEFKGDLQLAQSAVFFTAGFESASTTLSMTLYELALNPEIQEKLRREIQENIKANGGELTYEGVCEMKYLKYVFYETLRKYPPLPFLDRVCTKEYKIPGTDIVIEKGMPIYVSLYKGLHYDPKYFPEPEKYDPERFNEENKRDRHQYVYLPFGEGPRSCIGARLGYIAVRAGLCFILSNFKVEVCDKTPIPLVLDNRALMTSVKGGNHLKFIKISGEN